MRVLLDFRMQEAGVGRYGRDLIEGIVALPDAPDLVVFEAPRGPWRRIAHAPFTPWGRRAVAKAARGARAALLHGLHLELPKNSGIPAIVTIQDVIPILHPQSMPNRLSRHAYGRIIDVALRIADRVIVPSEATAQAVRDLGALPDRISVVPLGVSAAFHPSSLDGIEAARLRFAKGRPYVATLFRDKAHKNFKGVVEAMALLPEGAGLILAAAGEMREAPPGVHAVGRLNDAELRAFYAGAEVFVLPSLLEGFGLPALESIACGVPVICGRGVGAFPYIEPGVVEVDPADPNAISEAVVMLHENNALRESLSKAGLAAASELTIERAARETADLYLRVLTTSNAGR